MRLRRNVHEVAQGQLQTQVPSAPAGEWQEEGTEGLRGATERRREGIHEVKKPTGAVVLRFSGEPRRT